MNALSKYLLAFSLLALPFAALAQEDVNAKWDECQGVTKLSPEDTIASCQYVLKQAQDENFRADVYNDLAIAYGRTGDYDKAISNYGDALRITRAHNEPEFVSLGIMVRYNRAQAYTKAGRYDEALADYDLLLAAKPGFADYVSGRAEVQAALDRKKTAP